MIVMVTQIHIHKCLDMAIDERMNLQEFNRGTTRTSIPVGMRPCPVNHTAQLRG